jgi:hypothetical protein
MEAERSAEDRVAFGDRHLWTHVGGEKLLVAGYVALNSRDQGIQSMIGLLSVAAKILSLADEVLVPCCKILMQVSETGNDVYQVTKVAQKLFVLFLGRRLLVFEKLNVPGKLYVLGGKLSLLTDNELHRAFYIHSEMPLFWRHCTIAYPK